MEYKSLLEQPRELLYLQLSDDSVSYKDMVNVCRSNKFSKDLCETDEEFKRLKQHKIENLLLELTYPKVKELCGRHEEIQKVCDSDEFWKRKSHRDFGVFYEVPLEGKTWKEEYLELGNRYVSELFSAVENGDATRVQNFLDVGLSPNTTDDYGYPILMYASNEGYPDIVEMLLKAGANVDAKDSYHRATALIAASAKGYTDVVKLLLKANADVDAGDRFDETALMMAVSQGGNPDIVEMLINAGADVNAENKYGDKVLTIASRRTHRRPEIIKMLIDAGAKK